MNEKKKKKLKNKSTKMKCRRQEKIQERKRKMPKSDSTVRPVGDYRKLNAITDFDSYPTPYLHDFAHALHGRHDIPQAAIAERINNIRPDDDHPTPHVELSLEQRTEFAISSVINAADPPGLTWAAIAERINNIRPENDHPTPHVELSLEQRTEFAISSVISAADPPGLTWAAIAERIKDIWPDDDHPTPHVELSREQRTEFAISSVISAADPPDLTWVTLGYPLYHWALGQDAPINTNFKIIGKDMIASGKLGQLCQIIYPPGPLKQSEKELLRFTRPAVNKRKKS
ncbi:hypothetical protein AVEN_262629-1 [Araneus ventricosus]|uniref:Uncharacterized protein n=1 Tax=Araneus ventricosus TaxID=182803 RepID=A0A4Y2NY59_ARAVE|nr:hypothetical protein AVEN_262629-1 [Araneus ventricosus]